MIGFKIRPIAGTNTPKNHVVRDSIIVLFDYDWSKTDVKLDNGLFVPERYVIEEADEDAETAWGVTTDRKLINPQIVQVLSGKYTGRRAFVHYGAFEVAKWLDSDHHGLIPEKMIIFFIDPITCMPGTYLGDEVFEDLPRTESGIYLTPQLEDKVGIKIKITHVPKENGVLYYDKTEDRCKFIKIGDTVITVDSFQYDLTYQGKKYIKLEDTEIIGIEINGDYIPIGNSVLVEYLPDDSLAERVAENDKRRSQRDYIAKNFLHISDKYARGLDPDYLDIPEPKTINARLLAIGESVKTISVGDKLIVGRNFGCILPNKQWIINMDTVLGVVVE